MLPVHNAVSNYIAARISLEAENSDYVHKWQQYLKNNMLPNIFLTQHKSMIYDCLINKEKPKRSSAFVLKNSTCKFEINLGIEMVKIKYEEFVSQFIRLKKHDSCQNEILHFISSTDNLDKKYLLYLSLHHMPAQLS